MDGRAGRHIGDKSREQAKVPHITVRMPEVLTDVDKAAALENQHRIAGAMLRVRPGVLDLARELPTTFMRVVLNDERTGRPIYSLGDDVNGNYPAMHDEWQKLAYQHDRLVIWSHVEAGKTNQLTIGRVLWELGRNPNLRIAIISRTAGMAKKIVRTIGQYIEKNERLHAVFPRLKPTKDISLPWTSTELTVERDVLSKDPSVSACGVHGSINGSRIDLAIIDDILDWENTRTESQREEVWGWIQSMLIGRLTEEARLWALGNAWHPRDAMHKFAGTPGYKSFRFPVVSPTGTLSWPKQWSAARIEQRREELGPFEFPRSMLCLAREDSDARFKQAWIDKALARGIDFTLVNSVDHARLPEGYSVFHGVDLAVQQHSKADWTVMFSILLWPDGTRQLLNIKRGRWNGPDIVTELVKLHERFGGLIVVENVAAQDYIVQFAQGHLGRHNVKGFTTGKQKAHPEWGVEGLAAELDGGKWLIPNRRDARNEAAPPIVARDVDIWITEMLHYQPGEHTGDVLMAAWFAREAARQHEVTHAKRQRNGVGLRVIGGGKRTA